MQTWVDAAGAGPDTGTRNTKPTSRLTRRGGGCSFPHHNSSSTAGGERASWLAGLGAGIGRPKQGSLSVLRGDSTQEFCCLKSASQLKCHRTWSGLSRDYRQGRRSHQLFPVVSRVSSGSHHLIPFAWGWETGPLPSTRTFVRTG